MKTFDAAIALYRTGQIYKAYKMVSGFRCKEETLSKADRVVLCRVAEMQDPASRKFYEQIGFDYSQLAEQAEKIWKEKVVCK